MAKFLDGKDILVTGGAGFLGSRVVYELWSGKYGTPDTISVPRSFNTDLRKREHCVAAVKGKDVVIHLAANGGGIGYNLAHPGQLFYDNAIMGIQVVECARLAGVDKVVIIGTVCAYPKFAHVPFSEDDLWEGYPEETNAPYGLAKKMLLVQSQAYRQEFNFNSIYLLPVNLYGIGDDFSPLTSHVIPALIKKFVDAKMRKQGNIDVWGAGGVTREFLYVDDAARAIALATEHYNKPLPVNIGSGTDITIRNLAEKIQALVGFDGYIKWDMSKPEGQPARKLDVTRAKREFGFEAEVDFDEGLKRTVDWYMKKGD
jgi:GDP-L-fucose synthase